VGTPCHSVVGIAIWPVNPKKVSRSVEGWGVAHCKNGEEKQLGWEGDVGGILGVNGRDKWSLLSTRTAMPKPSPPPFDMQCQPTAKPLDLVIDDHHHHFSPEDSEKRKEERPIIERTDDLLYFLLC
jgi:hypothetical protein